MKISIITSGYMPVPAVKGGAVEGLVETIINENENQIENQIDVYSVFDNKAFLMSKSYKRANVIYIRIPKVIQKIDYLVYLFFKNVLKKEKSISYRYILQRLCFLERVARNIKKKEYDKVVLQNNATLFMALKLKKNFKKYEGKYYFHLHNEVTNTFKYDELIRNSKKIICVSNYIAKTLNSKLSISEDKYTVLKNCINIGLSESSEKERCQLKEKYCSNDKQKIILFVGRLDKEKGIKELLESLQKVKYKEYKLLIAGNFFYDTDAENGFKKELEVLANKLENKVTFLGYVPHDQISKYYDIADIAVLPSIWDEPAGLTIVEAVCSGIPVITTNSGGIPEYVENSGAIVLERDEYLVDNIAKNIEKLLMDDDLRRNLGKLGTNKKEEYTPKKYYEKFIEILR